MTRAVVCIVDSASQAASIVDNLKADGFTAADISVLFPHDQGTPDPGYEPSTKAPEGATAGGVAGGVLGIAVGWLIGVGSLAIPGLGPFIAAGPIMAALAGAAVGGAAGGVVGALIGLGIPEFEAREYEAKLRGGHILVSVHAEDAEPRERATVIFERHHAHNIATAGGKSVIGADGTNARES